MNVVYKKVKTIITCVLVVWGILIYSQETAQIKQENTQQASVMHHFVCDIPMRVLLDKKNISQATWTINSQEGYKIIAITDKKKSTFIYKPTELIITVQDNKFLINGKKGPYNSLFIIPVNNLFSFQNNTYQGALALTLQNGIVYLVNHLDLEDYVASVGLSESWPGWPDEVNKALCIAFRSYGIAKILEQRALQTKRSVQLPYDIQDSAIHQVYKGYKETEHFRKIVDATRGIVLAYDNKPILAMFDICCGGSVPIRKKGLHYSKVPYLARSYPCNHCKNYTYYKWDFSYSIKELESILKQEFPKLNKLTNIHIVHKDKAGAVHKVQIQGRSGWFSLTGKKLKSLLKKLKSICFTLEKKGSKIIFRGRGHGHLVGLCQHGAYQMVREGWNYKNILKFYYPGTYFMKLQKTKKRE